MTSPLAGEKTRRNANDDKKETKIEYRYLPYWRGSGKIYESIHVKAGAIIEPMFLMFDGNHWEQVSEISLGKEKGVEHIVRPVSEIPYSPYTFAFKEISELPITPASDAIERAFENVLETISPYQDTDENNLLLDSAGIVTSYFQHKLRSVPYFAKTADTESGKSRSLEMVNWTAYRPLYSVVMNAPNVYRFYGRDLQGVGTLIHDEIDDGKIDYDKALLAIYNAGYKYGAKVPRIGGENNDVQSYFNCFGMKWFGGIELPNSKAFNTRLIVQKYIQGIPEKLDITESDIETFLQLRKQLLVLRMLKDNHTFEQVESPLRGRSRELYHPLLTVLKGTKWYDIIQEPLLQFAADKKQEDTESKQAYTARAVVHVWLEEAINKLGLVVSTVDPTDARLSVLKDKLFVPNDRVISKMGLEVKEDKDGRKYLSAENIPHNFSFVGLGKIQSENLKGKPDFNWEKVDNGKNKKVRGYRYDLKTIRKLSTRYGTDGTFGTVSRDIEVSKDAENHAQNDQQRLDSVIQETVPPVPTVPIESFWRIFRELAKGSADGSVSGTALKRDLISSGLFDSGEATYAIEHLVMQRELEKVDFDVYRRLSEICKSKIFMDVFKRLSGSESNDVEEKSLFVELINSTKFDDLTEATKYFEKAKREGQIYERHTGFWAKA